MKRKQLPEIFVKQFNHKKNAFPLKELKISDTRNVWWICNNKHEWVVAPCYRIKYGISANKKKLINEIL
jgi:hypothetical protein